MPDDYDTALREIPFYRLHPEYMPYIGDRYAEYRILLIGESHYIGQKPGEIRYGLPYFREHWWNGTHDALQNEPYARWYNTRAVIERYLSGSRTKSHVIFTNIADVFGKTVLHTPSAASTDVRAQNFRYFAFLNFFQMPSLCAGMKFRDSLFAAAETADAAEAVWARCVRESADVCDRVLSLLRPRCVLVSSVAAYNAYVGTGTVYGRSLHCVPHAGCRWWNRPCAKYGGRSGRELCASILTKAYGELPKA